MTFWAKDISSSHIESKVYPTSQLVMSMSKKVKAKTSILEYLKKIYPKSATEKQILQEIGMSSCTCCGALRTLRARDSIEVVGKRGNANLYRFKPS